MSRSLTIPILAHFPGLPLDLVIAAAKDAAWYAAPGLSDAEHAEWTERLLRNQGAGNDLPLGLWDDACRRFQRNLEAIASGIPNAISHLL